MNWQWLIDNSFAIGILMACAAALALFIIYKYEEKRG